MNRHLRTFFLASSLMATSTFAQATIYTFEDTYIDGIKPTNEVFSTIDSIEYDSRSSVNSWVFSQDYNIIKTEVIVNGSQITFKLYAPNTYDGYFDNGIKQYGLGDLFLHTTTATTVWNYVVDLGAPTSSSNPPQIGTANLYQIVDIKKITNGTERKNQAALFDSTSANALATGDWSIDTTSDALLDYLRITIDLGSIWDGTKPLGFHWTMTCGNDIVQDVINPVPEPATMLLFGAGLLGVCGFIRRKAHR